MIRAILFDLDDTLLRSDTQTFFRNYVKLLAPHLAPWVPPDRLMALIWRGSEAMEKNSNPSRTTLDCFMEVFCAGAGESADKLLPIFENFYATDYQLLRQYTGVIPEARPLLEWVFGQGYEVVIATNPVFPEIAIRQRMKWAGIADFAYALVTSCETMHYAKPSPLYYEEILKIIGRKAEECVMVGNDPTLDMVASQVGIKTYLITEKPHCAEGERRYDGCGRLSELREWLARQP